MRRFRVSPLPAKGEDATLSREHSHHLLDVIRHPRGAPLVLWDGAGHQVEAVLDDVVDGCAVVRVCGDASMAAPAHEVHLILGLPKGPAADLAVRMSVEAGATHVHPVWAAHTQGRPEKTRRWQRIAESAAQQCGRADLPSVSAPASLGAALDALPAPVSLWIALPGAPGHTSTQGHTAVAIGPEGGWSASEVALMLERGATPLGLGSWVLRTDTASAVATAMVAS